MDLRNSSTPKKKFDENNRWTFMFKILILMLAANILTVVIFIHYSNPSSPAAAQHEDRNISHIQSLQNDLKLSISLNQHLISMLGKPFPHHDSDAG
ncbi:hypothetical protein M569_16749, partial [Genlisea aurea]